MPLTTRLVILLMAALLVITGLYDYVRLLSEHRRLLDETVEDARVFAETLALAVGRNIRWGRTSAELGELLEDILARPGLVAVVIYDPDGRQAAVTVAPGAAVPAADAGVRAVLENRRPVQERLAGAPGMIRQVEPVRWPGGRSGALEVRESLEGVEWAFRREIRERLVSRLLVLAAFVLSIAVVTRWGITRPIRRLIEGARAVGQGDLTLRLNEPRRDEIGQLAAEFDRMAENLQEARRALLHEAEERLHLEQAVQQAQKLAAIGQLAAEVAHEIGTPLNVISGRAELLERTVPPDHPDRRHLDLILTQTERIGRRVRALLEYSRPRQPELTPQSIARILARTADLLLTRCREQQVRIQLDLPVGLPAVLGDADQLQQLFLNLLLNALDVAPRGSILLVTTGEAPGLPEEGRGAVTRGQVSRPALAIRLLDRGGGIPADRLAQVFQPFFSTKSPGRGTGLGLPIAEEIIRAHQGQIEVQSVPGLGTEVVVRLPLAEAPVAVPGPGIPAGETA